MIYHGCPIEVAIKESYLWEFCVNIDNSKSFNITEMPFAQAHAYSSFIVDRNVFFRIIEIDEWQCQDKKRDQEFNTAR